MSCRSAAVPARAVATLTVSSPWMYKNASLTRRLVFPKWSAVSEMSRLSLDALWCHFVCIVGSRCSNRKKQKTKKKETVNCILYVCNISFIPVFNQHQLYSKPRRRSSVQPSSMFFTCLIWTLGKKCLQGAGTTFTSTRVRHSSFQNKMKRWPSLSPDIHIWNQHASFPPVMRNGSVQQSREEETNRSWKFPNVSDKAHYLSDPRF